MTNEAVSIERAAELPIVLDGQKGEMLGIYHRPEKISVDVAVLLIVGGPQNRWGSHRQFVLLARQLARQGIPVFRFDYCGMGDGAGEKTEYLEAGPDVKLAVDKLCQLSGKKRVVFWGLCDAVSLSLLYVDSYLDARIVGLVAANPWVRQPATEAEAMLKTYYLKKLTDPQLWRKVFTLQFGFRAAFRDLLGSFRAVFKSAGVASDESHRAEEGDKHDRWKIYSPDSYVGAMRNGLEKFQGALFLVMSGQDLTADEFRLLLKRDSRWQSLVNEKCQDTLELPESTHTFSSAKWRSQVEEFTCRALLQNFSD